MALPVTREEAKRQLKSELDEADQDDEIEAFIRDAAAWVEDYTGLILEAREVVEHFAGFEPVKLRAWPVDPTATVTVEYSTPGAPNQTVAARLVANSRPARVLPATGHFWPFIDASQNFRVTVRAGYENPDDVPRDICRAMLVLIAAFDADREGGPIFAKAEAAAKNLCRRYKRHTL